MFRLKHVGISTKGIEEGTVDTLHVTSDIGQAPTDYKLEIKIKIKINQVCFFLQEFPLSHMRSSNLTPVPHPFNNTQRGSDSHCRSTL